MSAFFHQRLSCTQSRMPPEGGGKQQLFTLTFTPAVNSVQLTCVFGLKEEADVETGRKYTLHTEKGLGIELLTFW